MGEFIKEIIGALLMIAVIGYGLAIMIFGFKGSRKLFSASFRFLGFWVFGILWRSFILLTATLFDFIVTVVLTAYRIVAGNQREIITHWADFLHRFNDRIFNILIRER